MIIAIIVSNINCNADMLFLIVTMIFICIRYYSLASASNPTASNDRNTKTTSIDLLLTLVEKTFSDRRAIKGFYPKFFANSSFKGFCTTYLANAEMGSKICLYLAKSGFNLPIDLYLSRKNQGEPMPLLWICAGSGIAPFRGFCQKLAYQDKEMRKSRFQTLRGVYDADKAAGIQSHDVVGENTNDRATTPKVPKVVMFFGCRSNDCNLLHEEMKVECKFLTRYVAFSQADGQPRQYNYELMEAEKELIYNMIVEEEGVVFVCGKNAMADSVKQTLIKILENQLMKMDECGGDDGKANEMANHYLNEMKSNNRYLQDIFG